MFSTIAATTLVVAKSVGSFVAGSFLVYKTGKMADKGLVMIGETIGKAIVKIKDKNKKKNEEPA